MSAYRYWKAHQIAKTIHGPAHRGVCPTCGFEKLLELSYVGTEPTGYLRDKIAPYDSTGRDYIYECRSCNLNRRSPEAKAASGRVSGRRTGLRTGLTGFGKIHAEGGRTTSCKRWNIDRGKPCTCGRHV